MSTSTLLESQKDLSKSNPYEQAKCLEDLKDSFIILTYTHALIKDSTENIDYFYLNYPNLLKDNFSLEKIQETFLKIVIKNSTTVLMDFLKFFKEKIKINEIFDNVNKLTLWQLCFKKRVVLLKDLLFFFIEEIELTLTEKDVLNNESFLLNAAKTNNQEFVKLLLKSPKIDYSKININRRFYENRSDTITTWATNIGDLTILKLLKKRFPTLININLYNSMMETCLIIAAKKGFVKIFDWIVNNFQSSLMINAKDSNEDTAFFKALTNEKFEICQKILQNFKNPLIFYKKANEKETLEILIIKGLTESFKFLLNTLKKMPDFHLQLSNKSLEKALGLAILKENLDMVNELIENFESFIDFGYINNDGKSLISFAVENVSSQNLSLLFKSEIEFKKMILLPDKFGETPLSLAIRANRYENFFFLLEKIPKQDFISIKKCSNEIEKTLLLLSQKAQWPLVKDLLLQNNILTIAPLKSSLDNNNTILHYLAKGGQLNLFKYLYQNYSSDILMIINSQNSDLETPLTVCARYYNWELLDFLLEIPKINLMIKDSSKRSFLCYVFSGADESLIMKILNKLKNSLDVNYSYLGLIKQKMWDKIVFLMKSGLVDSNTYDQEFHKSALNLIAEFMEPGQEEKIAEILELFDFEHQEILNVKNTIKILVQRNAFKPLKLYLTKLRFHDFLNQDFLEISEDLVQIKDKNLFDEIFRLILKMIEKSGNNTVDLNDWNNELIKLLPYKPDDLLQWTKKSPFKLNISHKFSEIKETTLLKIIIHKNCQESLRILLDFCEVSNIYITNIESLMIESLKNKTPEIAKILILYRYFDFTYKDDKGKPLIYYFVMENNLSLLQFCVEKLKDFDHNYLNKFGESAIVLAAQRNNREFLGFFLDNMDLNFNYENNEGKSFIYYMIYNQCFEYLLDLCRKNPDLIPKLDKADASGVTPFIALLKDQKLDECQRFLDFSKDINEIGIPTINLWHITKENKSINDYIKGNPKMINTMRAYGVLEEREKLIENEEIKNALSNGESTQMSNVDRTIKESIDRLQFRFNLSPLEITEENDKIRQFFMEDFNNESAMKYLEYSLYSAIKMKYKNSLVSNLLKVEEFLNVANIQLQKMLADKNFIHVSAKINNQLLLALIWKAIYDIKEISSLDEKDLKELIIQRQATLVRHLFEASKDGICARGQFNKTLECLNYSHDDIKIDMLDFSQNKILEINKEAINSIWKKLSFNCLENLPKKMKENFLNNVYFWGELDQFERQAILGCFKKALLEDFERFFPDLTYKEPTVTDYIVLEDTLGIFHKKQMIDFTII